MALPVGEFLLRRARHLISLLAPFPGRLEFAFRLAMICALTALVAELYQTPDPALTVYIAFFLIKRDRVTSIILSMVMLTVLTMTLLIVLTTTLVVIDQPVWRVLAMALISFGLMFLASGSKLGPIAPIVALIAAYAFDLLGTIQVGEIATRALLYVWLFVGIPAGVSILVNLLTGPAPRRLAERALAHRLRLAAAMLRGADAHGRHAFEAALREGNTEILTWLHLAGVEKTSSPADLAALQQAAGSVLRIMLLADMAGAAGQALLSPSCESSLVQIWEEMAAVLEAGAYPVEIDPPSEQSGLSPEAAAWQAEMRDILSNFAHEPPAPPSPAEKERRAGFLTADAFSNPVHVHHALKTTGAAMFCYILYSLLDWPTIHTCLITCYIVAQGTAAETVEKFSLRILGCLLGAAAGIAAIVFLVPDLTSIGALMVTVFLAALGSAWIAGGDSRIAYAGYQIAFAFFLCVLQGNGPSFDMVTARDRVIGILLGNIVIYLVFTNIWTVSVSARIDPAIAALLRKWSTLLKAGRQAAIMTASQALASFSALERDIDLVSYEPESIRPAAGWLVRRRGATESLAALAGPLWLSAREDPGLSNAAATCLDRIAACIGGAVAPVASPTPTHSDMSAIAGLRRQVETNLHSLEALLNDPIHAQP